MLRTRDMGALDPLERLRESIEAMGSVLVCYSGGVDSALVLAVAHEVLGARAVGMTAVSPSLAPFEKEAAVAIARQIGARHELVESRELERPGYVANASDRCFYCKSELYEIADRKQREWGLAHVLNGTNLDDLGDHRPGLEAAKNANVRSVLVECGFHKDDVRAAAHAHGPGDLGQARERVPVEPHSVRHGGDPRAARADRRARGRAAAPRACDRCACAGTRSAGPRGIARSRASRSRATSSRPHSTRAMQSSRPRSDSDSRTRRSTSKGYRMGSHNEVIAGRSLRVV